MSDGSVESTYIGRVGFELDVMLNVIAFDGKNGQSVSEHSAEAMQQGKVWGCVLCELLSVLVQKDHCKLVLTDEPTPMGAAIRALALILGVLGLAGFGVHEIIKHVL